MGQFGAKQGVINTKIPRILLFSTYDTKFLPFIVHNMRYLIVFRRFFYQELKVTQVILQLLDEMIDNGFPLTTEPNILKEMIAPPNIVSKVLSVVTGNSSNVNSTLPGATGSCVPWRTTELKHASNEVYVDLVEQIDAIINRLESFIQLPLTFV